jgi:hypothetical protein
MNDGANSHSDTDLRGSFSYILDSVAMSMAAVCSSKNLDIPSLHDATIAKMTII